MAERGVTIENIQTAVEEGRLFAYVHSGLIKIGYYDEQGELFLSIDQRHTKLVTAIRKSSRGYVDRLLERRDFM